MQNRCRPAPLLTTFLSACPRRRHRRRRCNLSCRPISWQSCRALWMRRGTVRGSMRLDFYRLAGAGLLACLGVAIATAADLANAGQSAHPPNAAVAAPPAALNLAASWLKRGGAHPADHCAAVALIGLGKYREAAGRLDALAQMMTSAPTELRAQVLDQAGQAWLLAGDTKRAFAAAKAAAALAPDDIEILIDRAEAAYAAGYLDSAVADLDRVLKADPNRVDALVYRASANRALDRLARAQADIDRALSLDPRSASALLERGNIRRLEGDLDGARSDWQQVGAIAPGSPEDKAARTNLEHLATPAVSAAARPGRRPPPPVAAPVK